MQRKKSNPKLLKAKDKEKGGILEKKTKAAQPKPLREVLVHKGKRAVGRLGEKGNVEGRLIDVKRSIKQKRKNAQGGKRICKLKHEKDKRKGKNEQN